MIEFKQKEYTAQSIARDNIGILSKIHIHILMLQLKLKGYEQDLNHHISEITGWIDKFWSYKKKDKNKIKDMNDIMNVYEEIFNRKSFLKTTTTLFRNKYEYKDVITDVDLNQSLDHMKACFKIKNKIDLQNYLKSI